MRLVETSLSLNLSLAKRLGQEFLTAGQALFNIGTMLLGQDGAGLAPAAPGQVRRLPAPCSWLTLVELVNEFLRAKARAGCSDRYLGQLRVSLSQFANGRARTPIDLVKAPDIEKWLWGNEWAPKTMHSYLGDVRTLFSFAVKRGYLERNPALGVETPAKPPKGDKLDAVQDLGADRTLVQGLPLGSFVSWNRLSRAKLAGKVF